MVKRKISKPKAPKNPLMRPGRLAKVGEPWFIQGVNNTKIEYYPLPETTTASFLSFNIRPEKLRRWAEAPRWIPFEKRNAVSEANNTDQDLQDGVDQDQVDASTIPHSNRPANDASASEATARELVQQLGDQAPNAPKASPQNAEDPANETLQAAADNTVANDIPELAADASDVLTKPMTSLLPARTRRERMARIKPRASLSEPRPNSGKVVCIHLHIVNNEKPNPSLRLIPLLVFGRGISERPLLAETGISP